MTVTAEQAKALLDAATGENHDAGLPLWLAAPDLAATVVDDEIAIDGWWDE